MHGLRAADIAVIALYLVGIASKIYTSGWSGIWYQWLWLPVTPFYWLIAPVMRRARAVTTADLFGARYDLSVAILYAVVGLWEASGVSAAQVRYDVRDFGAKADGQTLCTQAIQAAIDKCAAAGGGTVYVPPGSFLSGTIYMKTGVTLHLDSGCTLLGSTNLKDYPPTVPALRSYTDKYTDKSLIYGEKLERIAIAGRGVLDGQGAAFKGPYKVRPYMIRFIECHDVAVEGVTIRNSPMWVQHYLAGGGTVEQASRAIPEEVQKYPEYAMFGKLPAYGLYCRHVDGLKLANIQLQLAGADRRHAVVFDDVRNATLDGLDAAYSTSAAAPLRLTDARDVLIRGCRPAAGMDVFLEVQGAKTEGVTLMGNDFRGIRKIIEVDASLTPAAVAQTANRLD